MLKVMEPSPSQRIDNITGQRQQDECLLNWNWPKNVQYVYIYTFQDEEELPPEQLDVKNLKLITREEYKMMGGYRERIGFVGARSYRCFPCVMNDGELILLKQQDNRNLLQIGGVRAQVRYSIKYGWGLFSKRKSVLLKLFCEKQVPREALCYVKKSGSEPINREDGIVYPFPWDFTIGEHYLPEFEVGKQEYVRIFFTNGKRYGEAFELIREK
ncbi:hypothetical protein [Paenibacillus thalictri]|uniref:Beta-mannanase n=1 Tax=Paenibacillus thalictri TaxID=2527873 RepID=A0A4V2J4U5_9BACL|nr:hypothetical protein [Paenibacillus thalictri]TBL80982.1 hypothetical protein EYB31_02455 [Paenibacillus thalictri]